ncbi:MAG: hypothetical protein KME64_42205 [Scytonematopsis contorta HA4267-MV1]|jgi:hypothetical protein|nr:hypothetical protein [Scytonematopsis contorta HA4267-MV1]
MYYARLIYFKNSGKYYSESKLEILSSEVQKHRHCDNGDLAIMFVIVERIRKLSEEKQLPGLNCNWLNEGYIFVDLPDIGYPVLIKN